MSSLTLQPRFETRDDRTPIAASVVICAYTADRWDDLRRAVTSVRYQSRQAAEVVVVIDHNDALHERAARAFHDVIVVPNAGPKGLSGARNTGIAASSAPVVVFLDDDAVAERTWLAQLLAHYDDPLVVASGGEVLASWESGRPGWFPSEFDWVVGCSYRGLPRQAAAVRNVIGCNMSFRRDVLAEIGSFRSELGRVDAIPMGCEETELCIRALQRYRHGRIVYEPAAVVHHHVPANRATRDYFVARCRAEGRSKAQLCEFVGDRDGLASERSYTLRILPTGFVKGLADGVRLDRFGPARAVAIVAGLFHVAAGYVGGKRALRRAAAEAGR